MAVLAAITRLFFGDTLVALHVWPAVAGALLVLLTGLMALAPAALPVLPPADYSHVYGFLGSNAGAKEEQHTPGQLPQWLADRLGWPGMTATVARVYDRLPLDQRRVACIVTLNSGEAGAIDFFGPVYHLPHAISGHNTHWLWGPDSCTGTVVITVGFPRSFAAQSYRSVTWAATITCQYCMPEENGVPVYVARRPKVPPRHLWPSVKHYD